MKKFTALLLALVISLGLAACGGEKDDKKGNTDQLSSTVYVPQFIDIDVELDYINSGCSDGKNVYLVGNVSKETEATDPETGETVHQLRVPGRDLPHPPGGRPGGGAGRTSR